MNSVQAEQQELPLPFKHCYGYIKAKRKNNSNNNSRRTDTFSDPLQMSLGTWNDNINLF